MQGTRVFKGENSGPLTIHFHMGCAEKNPTSAEFRPRWGWDSFVIGSHYEGVGGNEIRYYLQVAITEVSSPVSRPLLSSAYTTIVAR